MRDLDPAARDQIEGFAGCIVIVVRNDYSKGLFNGDVGVIIKDDNDAYRAFFSHSRGYASFPVGLLPLLEPAFAMTVHKSQGSEFDDILLVFPEDKAHRLLTREIVYTGITRARRRVMLYGSPDALGQALRRRIHRQTGFAWSPRPE